MGSERRSKGLGREPGSLARAGRRGGHAQVPEPGAQPSVFPKIVLSGHFPEGPSLEYSENDTTSLEDFLVYQHCRHFFSCDASELGTRYRQTESHRGSSL